MIFLSVFEYVIQHVIYYLFRVWARTHLVHFFSRIFYHTVLSFLGHAHMVCGPVGMWNRQKSFLTMKVSRHFNIVRRTAKFCENPNKQAVEKILRWVLRTGTIDKAAESRCSHMLT